jgi:hypothetical protein
MSQQNLKGLRCILIVRCSIADEEETSIEKQIEMGQRYASQNGMIVVDKKEYNGASASLGAHYADLYKLVERKKNHEIEFDSFLFMAFDRFCRGGTEEGSRIIDDFATAGVVIVTVREGLISGKWAWLQRGLYLHEAQAYVQSLSFHVTSGWMKLLAAKKVPHCSGAPYGTDRLFLDYSGEKLFTVRELADGTRVKIQCRSGGKDEIFPKGQKGPVRQPNERVVLTPGDPTHIEVVRRIMRRRFMDGWGNHRIAHELNNEGIPAKRGGLWTLCSVHHVYNNPIYIGIGYTNTERRGIYCVRDIDKPIENATPRKRRLKKNCSLDKEPEFCTRLEGVPRPRSEWWKIEQPLLRDYLDDEVRPLVEDFHHKLAEKALVASGHQSSRKRGGDRHLDSPFILKNVLKEKRTGSGMFGYTSAKTKYGQIRYYRVRNVTNAPVDRPQKFRSLNASIVERQVLAVLKEVLADDKLLSERIAEHVNKRARSQGGRDSAVLALQNERYQLGDELKALLLLGPLCRELVQDKAQQIENRLGAIARSLDREHLPIPNSPLELPSITKSVNAQIHKMLADLPTGSTKYLRRLVDVVVPVVLYDAVTQELEFEVALPEWAISKTEKITAAFGVVTTPVHERGHQTNDGWVTLAKLKCNFMREKRPLCLLCKRESRAA